MYSECMQRVLNMYSEYFQRVFRVSSECLQSVFKLFQAECIQSVHIKAMPGVTPRLAVKVFDDGLTVPE